MIKRNLSDLKNFSACLGQFIRHGMRARSSFPVPTSREAYKVLCITWKTPIINCRLPTSKFTKLHY